MDLKIYETELTPEVLKTLIKLSEDWEAEDSCRGYRANDVSDIEGNRIFLAEKDGEILGYLFGHKEVSENSSSVMPEGTPFFETEEIFVSAPYRSQGIGRELFRFAEHAVSTDCDFMLLSTATKDFRSVLHFYMDELGMDFWSARLFKKIPRKERTKE